MKDPDSIDESYIIKVANASGNLLIDSGVLLNEITSQGAITNADSYTLRSFNGSLLPEQLATAVYQMFSDNMKSFYQSSSWGFNEKEKQLEFRNPMNRFLVVTDRRDVLIAFCMFRFEFDDEDEPEHPVLYCYELQVKESHRGQKIGAQLMSMISQIAAHFNLWKILLTVFKANVAAIRFYSKLGFNIDVNSPSSCGYHDECYEILSDKPNLR